MHKIKRILLGLFRNGVVVLERGLLAMLVLMYVCAAHAEEKPAGNEAPTPLALPSESPRYIDYYSSEQLNFAIDVNSIAIQPGPDNEVRYALRATSKQGAVNINYEAISCTTHQKIIYAIGQSDESWVEVRSPGWKPIYSRGINLQHLRLAHDYFCTGNTLSGSLESMRNRLIYNKPLVD